MVDDGGKVGGSPQLDALQRSVVGLDHSRDARAVRVFRVAVQSKLMRYLVIKLEGGERVKRRHHIITFWGKVLKSCDTEVLVKICNTE